jgi:hypothetical protein
VLDPDRTASDDDVVTPALQVEDALRVVPGVLEAAVVVGGPDAGTQVRVVLDDATDHTEVARAVHRMLQLQFGVGLDGDGVELVLDVTDRSPDVTPIRPDLDMDPLDEQIDGLIDELDRLSGRDFHADVLSAAVRHPAGSRLPEPRETEAASEPEQSFGRPAIARLALVGDTQVCTATVTLASGGGELRGRAEGPSGSTLDIVALATLRAVATLVSCDDGFSVLGVSTPEVGDSTVAVVQIECCLHGEPERLTGSSEVRGDLHQAVVRATLDAVNRRLPLLAPAL